MYAFNDDTEDMSKKMKAGSYNTMDLDKNLLSGLTRMGYKIPTPVQRKTLPVALAGMDVVCMARTGSGKTAAFLIPMLQKFTTHDSTAGVRGIVLSPTRELAVQTYRFCKDMVKFMDVRVASIIGGDAIEPQFEALSNRPDVLIATPGRLVHHLTEISTFSLKSVKYLVFDEADRLFEMGFADQLNALVKECSGDRQTLLFSATMPRQLLQFTRAGLREPQLIRLESDSKTSDELRMAFFTVRSNEKIAALLYLVRMIIPKDHMTIVFTATRHHSEYVHSLFQMIGVSSTIVYGTMDQDLRSSNLKDFRNGKISYLIVTDLAARGIDVPLLNNVINLHFPPSPKLFVHRCGRAARQGRIGYAFSLVEPEELAYMADVHTFLGKDVSNVYGIRDDAETSMTVGPGSYDANNKKIGSKSHKGNVGGTSVVPMSQHSDGYTLHEFMPEYIHTGLLPQDALDEENDFLQRVLDDDDQFAIMARIANNGMMQYRRTRNEATQKGVSTAKKLVKNNDIVAIHPLICGMDPTRTKKDMVEKANFIRILQTFRPAQTVLETGIGSQTGSTIIKGKGKKGTEETDGVSIMRALRKTTDMSLERNREKKKELYEEFLKSQAEVGPIVEKGDTVSHGEETHKKEEKKSKKNKKGQVIGSGDVWSELEKISALEDGGIPLVTMDEYPAEDTSNTSASTKRAPGSSKRKANTQDNDADTIVGVSNSVPEAKVRMSAAERKKLKKSGNKSSSHQNISSNLDDDDAATAGPLVDGYEKGSNNYADNKYYMAYGTEDAKAQFAEESLQVHSGLKTAEAQHAAMMEAAMIDVNPDDAQDMNNKRRIMRWDAKKRKYVKQSLQEIANLKGNNKSRSEGGTGKGKSAKPVGDMYNKWVKKTHREINTFKVMSDIGTDYGDNGANGRPMPKWKHNMDVPSELKNEDQIRKEHKIKDNLKMKNLPKEKRKSMEAAAKKKKKTAANAEEKKGKFVHKAARKQVKAIYTGRR